MICYDTVWQIKTALDSKEQRLLFVLRGRCGPNWRTICKRSGGYFPAVCFLVVSYILKYSVYTLCIDLYIGICSECYFERCWICDPTADRCWNCGFSWVLITVWLWFKYSLIMVLLWFVMTLYDKLRRRWTRKSSDCCSCCVDVAVQTGELFVKEAVDISPRYAFS